MPLPSDGARTLVLTAFLRGSASGHDGGSFSTATNLLKHVSGLVRRSPGLCGEGTLHVVHDNERFRHNETYGIARLHYFAADPSMPPRDARWRMFAHVLRSEAAGGWECAWATDMTDVDVLRLPPCSTSYYGEARLAVGTDACGLKPAWLRDVARRANYTLASSALRAFLNERDHQVHRRRQTLNCGLVGGLRATILPLIDQMSDRMARHHGQVPPPPHIPMDMLFWNEVVLEMEAQRRAPIVSGYPLGPVNLPMWGGLSDQTAFCPRHADPWLGQRVVCSGQCKVAWVNATIGHYWFGHKLKSWWTRFNADELKRGGRRPSCV